MAPAKLVDPAPLTPAELFTALLPWIILCIILLIWGTGWFKACGRIRSSLGTTRFPNCTT